VATLVRQAIDLAFPAAMELRLEAAKAILDADPMEVPAVEELRGELDELRGARR
jgi:hypothetical protein